MVDVADANETYFYHFDGLGSVAALSDVNNVLVERYAYDVFGQPTIRDVNGTALSASAVNNPYLFTGRRYDAEAGLYYYRARYYDFATARFLQPDPLGYADSLNLYQYCMNSPVKWVDPFGLTIGILGDPTLLEEAKAYLMTSDRFRDTYDKLDSSSQLFVIHVVEEGDTINFVNDRGTHAVQWNPHQAHMTLDGSSQSPALLLAHELEHLRNRLEGDHAGHQAFSDPLYQYMWKNREEYNVILGPERQIARELGEASRDAHRVVGTYDTAGPTVTWPADFVKYGQLAEKLARIHGWVGKKPDE